MAVAWLRASKSHVIVSEWSVRPDFASPRMRENAGQRELPSVAEAKL
jgi:hypothetical protein